MTPTVVAVHSSPTHSMAKPSRGAITLLAGIGIEDDVHRGETVQHLSRVRVDATKPNLRQVHLIHSELHEELRAAGHDMTYGEMGENVTTEGIDLLSLSAGTRLHLGSDAILEVTGLRNPCHQLNGLQPGLMEAVLDRDEDGNLIRKAGVMSVVIKGGQVSDGDAIEVVTPPEHVPLEPV
jgi:MOSC domain-containing protein YiiM